MNNADCLDKTIFDIFTDKNGNKLLRYLAYGYYVGEPEDKPYRFVEYDFFVKPISDIVKAKKRSVYEYESEYSDQIKCYITDCNEKELINFYKDYGSDVRIKEVNELTMDTECGCYIW